MQFSSIVAFVLPAVAAAMPTEVVPLPVDRRAVHVGEDFLHINLCPNIGHCVAALAPTVVSCASAAIKEGRDVLADAACIAGAVNTVVNKPAACDGCF